MNPKYRLKCSTFGDSIDVATAEPRRDLTLTVARTQGSVVPPRCYWSYLLLELSRRGCPAAAARRTPSHSVPCCLIAADVSEPQKRVDCRGPCVKSLGALGGLTSRAVLGLDALVRGIRGRAGRALAAGGWAHWSPDLRGAIAGDCVVNQ